ncbi:hypothetical protein DFH09DRAFT_1075410 [Mycena vulgaris]|nr:hypothetical protein DFH09DRAFT_1075410 [Mycena vulgaris]
MPTRTISNDLKARVPVLFFEQDRSVAQICSILGVKKTFVYNCLEHYTIHGVAHNPNTHPSGRCRLLTAIDIRFIEALLEQTCTIHLDELQEKLLMQHNINVSLPTLFRTLQRLHLSHKCVSVRALERNDIQCSAYMNRIADVVPDANMLMFIDEAAKNDHSTGRSKGWSLIGTRLSRRFPGVGYFNAILAQEGLDFKSSEDNYMSLLKMILLKHGEDKYNITKKITYGIKVQLPGVNKTNSLDIDNLSEYQDLVTSIIEGLQNNQGSDNEDGDGEEAGLYNGDGLTDLERELARLRGKLEKHWQNDHDAGYTYIDPRMGESYPLTPQLMKEWCRAMYDGQATVTEPPKFIAAFDPANRQGAGTENNRVVEVIGHLATMVSALVGVRSGQFADVTPVPSTPRNKAPAASSAAATVTSPVVPSPTKLPRFLEHAEKNLGITAARTYESGMATARISCILWTTKTWWSWGCRKEIGTITPFPPFGDTPATPPSKKVAFERRYDDGGAERFYGPAIFPGDDMGEVWYRCPVRNTWGPVPLGYRSVMEEEGLASDEEELDLHKQAEKVAENEQATKADAAAVLAGLHNA